MLRYCMLPARRGVLAPLGVHSHARSSSSSSSSSSRALTLSLPRCAQGGTLGSRLYSSLLSSPSSSSSSSSSTPLRALSMALHTRGLSTTRGVGGASPNNKSELDSLDFSAEDGSFAINDIDPPVLSDAHYSRLHNFVNKRKEDLTEAHFARLEEELTAKRPDMVDDSDFTSRIADIRTRQNRVLLESPVQWKQDFQIRPVLALLQRHSRLQQLQRYLDNEQPVLQKKVLEANQSAQYETIFTYDRPKPISRRARKHSCMFCRPDTSDNQEKQLVVTNVELLLRFVNIRGMLLNRRTTGLCGPHQRKVSKLIKRARGMALMSEVSNFNAGAYTGNADENEEHYLSRTEDVAESEPIRPDTPAWRQTTREGRESKRKE